MGYNPDQHHRRSIRLRGYDYAQAGLYFVTICTQGKECLFGGIVDGELKSSEAGRMIQSVWDELPHSYSDVDLDAFVLMPNHVHGIVVLTVGAGPRACPGPGLPPGVVEGVRPGQARGPAPTMSLPDVVHRFKSLTTARYRQGVTQHGWPPFPGRLWQRNYYEHIIRNEKALDRIRIYIEANPARWASDDENPINAFAER